MSFVQRRAAQGSLFFMGISALLHLATSLYPRSGGLLEGHLRLRHLLFQPPTSARRGGLAVQLLMAKKRKTDVDLRRDMYPVPWGPAVQATLAFLAARGLLSEGADPDSIVFPDIDPIRDTVAARALTVRRSSYVLKAICFRPIGHRRGRSAHFTEHPLRQKHRCSDGGCLSAGATCARRMGLSLRGPPVYQPLRGGPQLPTRPGRPLILTVSTRHLGLSPRRFVISGIYGLTPQRYAERIYDRIFSPQGFPLSSLAEHGSTV